MRHLQTMVGLILALVFMVSTGSAQRIRSTPATTLVRGPLPLAAPDPVTATPNGASVDIAWQGVADAARYDVIRSPDTTSAVWNVGIAGAHAPNTQITDRYPMRGFYRVTTVAADGRQASSAWVQYPTPVATLMAETGRRAVTAGRFGLTITGASGPYPPNNGQLFVDTDDTVTVSGTNLVGAAVTLLGANRGSDGAYRLTSLVATQAPIGGAGLRFVPQAPIGHRSVDPFYIVVSRSMYSDTSAVPIFISRAPVIRKITSVDELVIRSGRRFVIRGVGFDEVIGGYAGTGTRGSVQNSLLSMWNRGPNSVELATTASRDQEGPLMLEMPVPGGSPIMITGDQAITVACLPTNPKGAVEGTSLFTPRIYVKAGSTITIAGKNLRYVTRVETAARQEGDVFDNVRSLPLPFTLQKGATAAFDRLLVTLPTAVGVNYTFYLENVLTNPTNGAVADGLVTTIP